MSDEHLKYVCKQGSKMFVCEGVGKFKQEVRVQDGAEQDYSGKEEVTVHLSEGKIVDSVWETLNLAAVTHTVS